jgi:outer membrane receptor protein involved in Fe transport
LKPAPSPSAAPPRGAGATPLKAEKARNYSLGLLLQPSRNWTTSIDAYRIDIDDRIALSANMTLNQTLKDTLAKQGCWWARAATSPTPSTPAPPAWTC